MDRVMKKDDEVLNPSEENPLSCPVASVEAIRDEFTETVMLENWRIALRAMKALEKGVKEISFTVSSKDFNALPSSESRITLFQNQKISVSFLRDLEDLTLSIQEWKTLTPIEGARIWIFTEDLKEARFLGLTSGDGKIRFDPKAEYQDLSDPFCLRISWLEMPEEVPKTN